MRRRTVSGMCTPGTCCTMRRSDLALLSVATPTMMTQRLCSPRAAGGESAGVAHAPGDAQQRDRIEIEHRLGIGMVALADVVAGEAENIAPAPPGRTPKVGLA